MRIILLLLSFNLYANCFNDSPLNQEVSNSKEIEAIMQDGNLDALTVLIADKDRVLTLKHFGNASANKNVYDLASITKLFTASSILKLQENNEFKIFTPLNKVLSPIYTKNLTIENLLRHTSGFKPGLALSERNEDDLLSITPNREYGRFKYSDINFLLLGKIIEKKSYQSLDVFIYDNFFTPLLMADSKFNPKETTNIHPTLLGVKPGVVHDPTAKEFNGIAGSAGIFTTAKDLARFSSIFLNEGKFCARTILSKSSVAAMTKYDSTSKRGLGFDILSAYSNKPRSDFFKKYKSFGHTGYTGTSLWIDPVKNKIAIFLSNATYTHTPRKTKATFYKLVKQISQNIKVKR